MEWSSISLPEPWERFVPGQEAAFVRELEAELSASHPLHGLKLAALAHSTCSDAALFKRDGRSVVEVHLTWSGRAEQVPWPRHKVYDSLGQWAQHATTSIDGE
jgi:hypothetical protein